MLHALECVSFNMPLSHDGSNWFIKQSNWFANRFLNLVACTKGPCNFLRVKKVPNYEPVSKKETMNKLVHNRKVLNLHSNKPVMLKCAQAVFN